MSNSMAHLNWNRTKLPKKHGPKHHHGINCWRINLSKTKSKLVYIVIQYINSVFNNQKHNSM